MRTRAAIALAAGLAGLLARAARGRGGASFASEPGVRLHYSEKGAGPPLVLLHGFAVDGDVNWRVPGITAALARDFRVISPDLRGHGGSGKPHAGAAYGARMAGDILRLLDYLGIARAHLAGYSLGGFVALYLAALHPARFASAAILAAGWEPPENPTFMTALARLAADLRAGHGIDPLSGYLGGERRPPTLLHKVFVRVMTGWFNDKEALAALLDGLPGLAVPERALDDLALPLCAIVGSEDPLRVSAEALAARVPGTTLVVVEGANHIGLPLREEAQAALRAFLLAAR